MRSSQPRSWRARPRGSQASLSIAAITACAPVIWAISGSSSATPRCSAKERIRSAGGKAGRQVIFGVVDHRRQDRRRLPGGDLPALWAVGLDVCDMSRAIFAGDDGKNSQGRRWVERRDQSVHSPSSSWRSQRASAIRSASTGKVCSTVTRAQQEMGSFVPPGMIRRAARTGNATDRKRWTSPRSGPWRSPSTLESPGARDIRRPAPRLPGARAHSRHSLISQTGGLFQLAEFRPRKWFSSHQPGSPGYCTLKWCQQLLAFR